MVKRSTKDLMARRRGLLRIREASALYDEKLADMVDLLRMAKKEVIRVEIKQGEFMKLSKNRHTENFEALDGRRNEEIEKLRQEENWRKQSIKD